MITEETQEVPGTITVTTYKVDGLEFKYRSDAEEYVRGKEEKEIESQLLPCPACKSKTELYKDDVEWAFGIRCTKCDIHIRALNRSKKGAMETWNTCLTKKPKMKYKVNIPVMCYVEVEVELDSEERDDIIEKALTGFEIHRFSKQSMDVETPDGEALNLLCDGYWDDQELITIKTIQE